MKLGQMFPLRLLGFGFYWAWLFLVGVSPSPLVGDALVFSVPLEPVELILRLLFTALFFVLGTRLSTTAGKAALALVGCLGGPIATMALFAADSSLGITASVVGIALVDAATFILWLCFFGRMKFGGVALYMALSYCIGGLLSLCVQVLPGETGPLIAAFLPVFSSASFYLSDKFHAERKAHPQPRRLAEPLPTQDKTDREEVAGPWELPANSSEEQGSDIGKTTLAVLPSSPYLMRMGIALACYAFIFALASASLFTGILDSRFSGSAIESVDCLILSLICGALMLSSKQMDDLYALYRVVPITMIVGVSAGVLGIGGDGSLGMAVVVLGYLMFEITALNDYCVGASSLDKSLTKTFCAARLAITAGLILGWIAAFGLCSWATQASFDFSFGNSVLGSQDTLLAKTAVLALSALAVIVASTLVFTTKEISSAHSVAVRQEELERLEDEKFSSDARFKTALDAFARAYKLSQRETDIVELLLRGRTVTYISEQLFIAAGTVKTHTHNIYSKLEIHSKMELLDLFDEFQSNALGH